MDCSWGSLLLVAGHYIMRCLPAMNTLSSLTWDPIKHIWMKTHRTTSSTSYKKCLLNVDAQKLHSYRKLWKICILCTMLTLCNTSVSCYRFKLFTYTSPSPGYHPIPSTYSLRCNICLWHVIIIVDVIVVVIIIVCTKLAQCKTSTSCFWGLREEQAVDKSFLIFSKTP